MAIAPLQLELDIERLEELEGQEDLQAVWPRPVLRLVTSISAPDLVELEPAPSREDVVYLFPESEPEPVAEPLPVVRRGADLGVRRARPQSLRVRRRRTALATCVIVLLGALVLPVSLLGGRTPDGASSLPGAALGGTGVTYVVQPGDTLPSIAARVDPSDPTRLASSLAAQTGSSTVVPGEHLTLP